MTRRKNFFYMLRKKVFLRLLTVCLRPASFEILGTSEGEGRGKFVNMFWQLGKKMSQTEQTVFTYRTFRKLIIVNLLILILINLQEVVHFHTRGKKQSWLLEDEFWNLIWHIFSFVGS